MDELQSYWQQMPNQNTDVYFEILPFFQVSDVKHSLRTSLTQTTIDYFKENLIQNTYPTLKILQLLPSYLVADICHYTLMKLAHCTIDKSSNIKLFNLLTHIDYSPTILANIRENLFPLILNEEKYVDIDCWLCWMMMAMAERHQMLRDYLVYRDEHDCRQLTKNTIFCMAMAKGKHFLEPLILQEHMIGNEDMPDGLNELTMIVQSLGTIENDPSKNDNHNMDTINCINPERLNQNQFAKYLFIELKRLLYLQNALVLNIPKQFQVSQLAGQFNVIDFLAINLDLATFDRDAVESILKENHRNNCQIDVVHLQQNTLIKSEIDLYEQYSAIKLFVHLIMTNKGEQDVANDIKDIKKIMRNMEMFRNYIELLEVVFSLVFLRWEHLEDYRNLDRTIESGSESEKDQMAKQVRKHEKYGFMCTLNSLDLILNLLKMSSNKKKHSDEFVEATDKDREQFLRIYESISDAHWRLNLFKCDFTRMTADGNSKFVDTKRFISQHHSREPQKSSSDDESNHNKVDSKSTTSLTPPRRKQRKRLSRRSDGDRMSISFSHSTELDKQNSDGLQRKFSSASANGSGERRSCIISKMLGTPKHLIAVCMDRGDLEMTKQLIKTHSLESSDLAAELTFSSNFKQTKQKLKNILQKYEKVISTDALQPFHIPSATDSPTKTIEQIKKAAAIGFELSKITNIINRFVIDNPIKHRDPNEIGLIDKYRKNYPFLNYYKSSDVLQATVVTDILISVGSNYDVCLNVLNMLTTMWNKYGNSSDSFNRPDQQMGYFSFVKNGVDCLQSLKQMGENDTGGIGALLIEQCYSMNPVEFSMQLMREKNFKQLMQLQEYEYNSFEQLKLLQRQFDQMKVEHCPNYFQNILYFLTNATRLLLFISKEVRMFNNRDMLNLNYPQLIGQIIFVSNVSPIEIECIVTNMHMNLLWILIWNTCPTIEYNLELDYTLIIKELENDCNSGNISDTICKKLYQIENVQILDYIKKYDFLVAFLVQEIQSLDFDLNEPSEFSSQFLKNLCGLEAIDNLSLIYENNVTVAALNFEKSSIKGIVKYIETCRNYGNALSILQSVKDFIQKTHTTSVQKLTDWLIKQLLTENTALISDFLLLEHMYDLGTKAKLVLDNICKIECNITVRRIIKHILLHRNVKRVKPLYRKQLKHWLDSIEVYVEISEICFQRSWLAIMEMSRSTPEQLLEELLQKGEYELCLKWTGIYPLHETSDKFVAFTEIFSRAVQLECGERNDKLFRLIESLPIIQVVALYGQLLRSLRNPEILEYIVFFLMEYNRDNAVYQKYQISLKIYRLASSEDEQENMWKLMSMPLVIIEQYLMNSKFEILSTILTGIKPFLRDASCQQCCEQFNSNYGLNLGSNFKILDLQDTQHSITQHCLDALLRCYAAKALDFHVSEMHSFSDMMSHTTDLSLDSLCGTFIMPKEPLTRNNWIRDDEASHCMCCRRAVFTMLTRRHHCRQCGRVVCHACSIKRMAIPSLYADVLVRVCADCFKQLNELNARLESPTVSVSPATPKDLSDMSTVVWQFSGNAKHDDLLRDEFCFEYAPSISLCLSILAFHSATPECANFMLYYCQKFESLLKPLQPGLPNPEIDYGLVTKMLHCLALAAKFRGGSAECDTVVEHAEIIRSIVQNRCEKLLPIEQPNSFRKLRDSLVEAEKWSLALEVSLKCGFSTSGVMAAYGIACLKAGCFDTAREKLAHCMTKPATDDDIFSIHTIVSYESSFDINKLETVPRIKRQAKSPPLLAEIIHILEITCHPAQPDATQRATIIRESNSSLSSNRSKRKENIPCHEPAINILNTLANLKNIIQDTHTESSNAEVMPKVSNKHLTTQSRFYDESIYYLINYGNHNDIVRFLVKHDHIITTLKYFIYQTVDSEIFIQALFLPYFKRGQANLIVKHLIELDETLSAWQTHINQLCLYFERKGYLNCLYHLQVLFKDPVRASMTCVKFYTMDCSTFTDLQNNSIHLNNAQRHLQQELELCQWEEIKVNPHRDEESKTLLMKMDSRKLNSHINTVWRQLEVTKFLAKCEQDDRETVKLLPKICLESSKLPTLFGSVQDKIQLAVLTLICGTNIEEGFGLAYRIIQELNLSQVKVFGLTTKYLAGNNRLNNVEQLINCIHSNDCKDKSFCDEIISLAITTATSTTTPSPHQSGQLKLIIDSLIQLIGDVGCKIECFIMNGQLKSAYLLAVQFGRMNDVKKVLRQAEQTNQMHIKKLCEKKLNISIK